MKIKHGGSLVWAVGFGSAACTFGQVQLQSLGVPAGMAWSSANGVSADGTTVYGAVGPSTAHALPMIWTAGGGFELLGTATYPYGYAEAVSDDGSVVVGWLEVGQNTRHAFRWTRAGGLQDLGLPFGATEMQATAVSADGSVVCGTGTGASSGFSFRWTIGQGPELISTAGFAGGMTADGATVVLAGRPNGFLWNRGTGLMPLPAPPPAWQTPGPGLITPDGTFVAGILEVVNSPPAPPYAPFVWSAINGYRVLEQFGDLGVGAVFYISPDASVLFGQAPQEPFMYGVAWTPQGLMLTDDYLRSRGIGTAGLSSTEITGATPDLRTLVGFGSDENDDVRAWIVTVPAACYPNCDGSSAPPVLNVNDFICFQTQFAAGTSYANCDQSTSPPVLNVNDFLCFQARFAAGCE